MDIVFMDQAWDVFSKDAEKDGVISQYVAYIIERARNNMLPKGTNEEKTSNLGNAVITYEITDDKIVLKSIVL